MPAESEIQNFTSVIEGLVKKLDSLVDPSSRPNGDYSRWAELHHQVTLLEKSLADECRRSTSLEDEIEDIDEQHNQELSYLENQRKKDLHEIEFLEEKLKQMEHNQGEEREKLTNELKLLKTKFKTNIKIFNKLLHLNAIALVNRMHDASKDTLFLTTSVRQLTSDPDSLLTVQPLTTTVVADVIRAARQSALQASPLLNAQVKKPTTNNKLTFKGR
ncbi:uncharacterized protein LOC118435778 [Folsomia candida]|nr:uncharacterized protein LOC118435778 [Folsomia candida]